MNKNEILVWVHPLWTSYLGNNINELDKVISFVNTFELKLILLPKIHPKFKTLILRSAILNPRSESSYSDRLRIEFFDKILSRLNPIKTLKIKGNTSRYNFKSNYSLVNSKVKRLIKIIFKRNPPIFKGEVFLNKEYFEAEKHILKNVINPAVINHASNFVFIEKMTPNNNYVLIGEYSNQCVEQVYNGLKEKGCTVRIEDRFTICNGSEVFDKTKEYLYIEHED